MINNLGLKRNINNNNGMEGRFNIISFQKMYIFSWFIIDLYYFHAELKNENRSLKSKNAELKNENEFLKNKINDKNQASARNRKSIKIY